ncbi:hypothetical protein C2S51_016577 [Perilla frutescens var. frutescens]|nr:hypothetical protein C2S51_016577 [Perilla frutescens var. frutescens]
MSKRVGVILFVVLAAMAVMGESSRVMKSSRVFENLLENRLPRGPVPPSGPSRCHNKLDPSAYEVATQEDSVCP